MKSADYTVGFRHVLNKLQLGALAAYGAPTICNFFHLLVLIQFVFRPPDIVVGGLRFYRDSIFFFFYLLSFSFTFVRLGYPPSSMNEIQPKSATCSEVSAVWKCMSEIWGIGLYPPRTFRGPYNHIFSTTSQLNDNFNGLHRPNDTRNS